MPFEISLVIGVFFGFIASLMAVLIFYDEYQKHRFVGWQLWKHALSGGIVTFIVFLILALTLGYLASDFSR